MTKLPIHVYVLSPPRLRNDFVELADKTLNSIADKYIKSSSGKTKKGKPVLLISIDKKIFAKAH